jgi:hypothetical protein
MGPPQPYASGNGNGDDSGNGAATTTTGRRICGARTRSGRQCQQQPLMGRTRCRLHGGASPAGVASPHFRHGKRSRYIKNLPQELRAGYKAAREDEDLLSLADELALLTTRAGQLLDKLKEVEQPVWGRAQVSLNALTAAVQDGDAEAVQVSLERHRQVVQSGADAATTQARTWAELRQVIQERTRTAAAEWKRMADLGMLVEVSKFQLFVQVILTAARECVTDKGMLKDFVDRTLALLPPEK